MELDYSKFSKRVRKRVFRLLEITFGLVLDVEDDFEHGLTSRKLSGVEFLVVGIVTSSKFSVFGRLVPISVAGTNQTQQQTDTKFAIRSILMFPLARPR